MRGPEDLPPVAWALEQVDVEPLSAAQWATLRLFEVEMLEHRADNLRALRAARERRPATGWLVDRLGPEVELREAEDAMAAFEPSAWWNPR